jgi:hypothetical protein
MPGKGCQNRAPVPWVCHQDGPLLPPRAFQLCKSPFQIHRFDTRCCRFKSGARPAAILGLILPAWISAIHRATVSRTASALSQRRQRIRGFAGNIGDRSGPPIRPTSEPQRLDQIPLSVASLNFASGTSRKEVGVNHGPRAGADASAQHDLPAGAAIGSFGSQIICFHSLTSVLNTE